jgi:hypothetical protein
VVIKMAEGTVFWKGIFGQKYKYWIYTIGTAFKDKPGNYIFAKRGHFGRWTPLYIGESDNLREILSNHEKLPCIERNGGTHIHVHMSSSSAIVRRAEVSDLRSAWRSPCNKA